MIEYSLTYAQQRASDLQAIAAAHTLVQEARANRQSRLRFYAPALASVGRQMRRLGVWLEDRYSECKARSARAQEAPQWN